MLSTSRLPATPLIDLWCRPTRAKLFGDRVHLEGPFPDYHPSRLGDLILDRLKNTELQPDAIIQTAQDLGPLGPFIGPSNEWMRPQLAAYMQTIRDARLLMQLFEGLKFSLRLKDHFRTINGHYEFFAAFDGQRWTSAEPQWTSGLSAFVYCGFHSFQARFGREPIELPEAIRWVLIERLNEILRTSSRSGLDYGPEGTVFNIYATTLLGIGAVQLAQALSGERIWQQCEICGRHMDITGKRSDTRVHPACSKRARQAKWRMQKRDNIEAIRAWRSNPQEGES